MYLVEQTHEKGRMKDEPGPRDIARRAITMKDEGGKSKRQRTAPKTVFRFFRLVCFILRPSSFILSAMSVLIVAASHSGKSRSQRLARIALRKLTDAGTPATLLDLREYPLPFAGSAAGWSDPNVAKLSEIDHRRQRISFSPCPSTTTT